MKKLLLATGVSLLSLTATHGQTLTAANLNPVAGDVFYGYACDTTHATKGAAGTGVTWDQTLLVTDSTDTSRYFACAVTPFCDSFPGTNIVGVTDSQYAYGIASASGLVLVGGVDPTNGLVHFTAPKRVIYYPLSVGTSHADTAAFMITAPPVGDVYIKIADSFYCDASGTLKLPGGAIYTGVLRVHNIETLIDSFNFLGTPVVAATTSETYSWYVAGFHNPLLTITYDTTGATSPYVSTVKYYKKPVSVGIGQLTAGSPMHLYPNPAADVINIICDASGNSAISITNLVGSTVATFSPEQINTTAGHITYNTAALPAGVYVAHMQTAAGMVAQKFTVTH